MTRANSGRAAGHSNHVSLGRTMISIHLPVVSSAAQNCFFFLLFLPATSNPCRDESFAQADIFANSALATMVSCIQLTSQAETLQRPERRRLVKRLIFLPLFLFFALLSPLCDALHAFPTLFTPLIKITSSRKWYFKHASCSPNVFLIFIFRFPPAAPTARGASMRQFSPPVRNENFPPFNSANPHTHTVITACPLSFAALQLSLLIPSAPSSASFPQNRIAQRTFSLWGNVRAAELTTEQRVRVGAARFHGSSQWKSRWEKERERDRAGEWDFVLFFFLLSLALSVRPRVYFEG